MNKKISVCIVVILCLYAVCYSTENQASSREESENISFKQCFSENIGNKSSYIVNAFLKIKYIIGLVANSLGFSTTIRAGSIAAKLMAWTQRAGRVFGGVAYLQKIGATIANAGIVTTLVKAVSVTIGGAVFLSYTQCRFNSTVEPIKEGELQEMVSEFIEAFRERGKELCEKVLGDQCDFRIFWENVKNSTGKFVKRKMENKAPTED